MLWETGIIHIMGHQDLAHDKPELAEFLSNMYLTDSELADLMVVININESDEDNEEVARQWMQNMKMLLKTGSLQMQNRLRLQYKFRKH